MLIRKPLHGNLRPNPGDLYDPRDGTCLPNFHLSTTHNPNLAHITQDLVKYDIQLVREVGNAMPLSGYSHENGANNPMAQHLSLTLLAVAEYSEGLAATANNKFPFVVHKVFYREAIAGVLLLRHKISDRDMVLMQNVLRKSIPNPENFTSKLFEQSISSIQKVSIIQHGQEYHYTNIKMAFMEVSKIVNFVCSPSNLNARSVLVDIPGDIDYRLLNENKYLAYLYEQERQRKEREEQKRLHEKRRKDLLMMELQQRQIYQNYRYDQQFTNHSHHSTGSYYDTSDTTTQTSSYNQRVEGSQHFNGSHAGQSTLNSRRYFVRYPIDMKIQTKNGKKLVTYNKTGQRIIYEPEDEGFNRNGYGILIEVFKKTDTKKQASSSTPNLLDDNLYRDKEEKKQMRELPVGSYLRARSYSFEDLNERDKIDRYPAPLIEPGRRSVRERTLTKERMDKWKKLSPQYWAAGGNRSFDSMSSDGKESHGKEAKKDFLTVPTRNASQGRSSEVSNGHQKTKVTVKSTSVPHHQKKPPQRTLIPHSKFSRDNNDDNVSVVSAFSDISITPQQQVEAEKEFAKYFDHEETKRTNAAMSTNRTRQDVTRPQSGHNYTASKFQHTTQSFGSQRQEYRVYQQQESREQQSQYQQAYNRQQHHQETQKNYVQYHGQPQKSSSDHMQSNAAQDSLQQPTRYTKPVNLHPSHLQAAEYFINKHADYFSSESHNSSFADTPPTSLGSLQADSDSTLMLDHSPSATPTPAGGDTLDRDFVYRACLANVREI